MEIIKNGFVNERLGVELDVYVIDGKEWFDPRPLVNLFGVRDVGKLVDKITDQNDKGTQTLSTLGGNQLSTVITETGLYEIVFSISQRNAERYAKAMEFKRWVFSEVLPSLRKTNSYVDEKYITDPQREELVKDQARKLDNYSSVFEQSVQSRNLKKFLEHMFKDRIVDPFEQFIEYMKIYKTLDCDNIPTEKFRELNKKHDYFKWQLEVDHEDKWKIEVKPNGMKHLLDTLGEENGKLIFRKGGD